MRSPRFHLKLPLRVEALVALALAAGLAGSSAASAADSMPGMTAEQHAHMSSSSEADSMPGMTAEQHARMSSRSETDSMPGMTAEEHAQMSGGGHDAMPGMSMSGHDERSADTKRPVALVLGGFGLLSALVLGYAAVIRRRPDAVKRRETLARVRSAAGKPTVPSTSKSAVKS